MAAHHIHKGGRTTGIAQPIHVHEEDEEVDDYVDFEDDENNDDSLDAVDAEVILAELGDHQPEEEDIIG